jgi:Family of unknown function (DUF5677)
VFMTLLTPDACPDCEAITDQYQSVLNEAAFTCLEDLAKTHLRQSHRESSPNLSRATVGFHLEDLTLSTHTTPVERLRLTPTFNIWGKATMATQFGFPDANEDFERRHPLFPDRMTNLVAALNIAFVREQEVREVIEKFVYFFGILIAEDFMEIILVASNGYGAAATKLLRSMYEHTITLKYLNENPEEIQKFLDFNVIQRHNRMKQIQETFGESTVPPEDSAEAEAQYKEMKPTFMVKSCKSKACTEMKLNHSWSKLNFVAMAKKSGDIGKLIFFGYTNPLKHAHPTLGALHGRLEMVGDRLEFKSEAQPSMADEALMTAHCCVLTALEVQGQRFKIDGLAVALDRCTRDWRDIWSPGAKLDDE